MAQSYVQRDILGDLAAKAALHEVGIEKHHVEREWRVARGVGLAAAILDEQLPLSGAVARVDAVEVALEQCAHSGAAGEAVVFALFTTADQPEPPALVGECGQAADRIAVIDAAILARHPDLR